MVLTRLHPTWLSRGLVILVILGYFSASHAKARARRVQNQRVSCTISKPPKPMPEGMSWDQPIKRPHCLTMVNIFTGAMGFSQISWRFLLDLPLNQSIERSEKNLEILGGIACKLCHCDSSIKLATQI